MHGTATLKDLQAELAELRSRHAAMPDDDLFVLWFLSNPQVINGQQTTRTLAEHLDLAKRASVLVKVIRIPRDSDGRSRDFDALVSSIVAGTNWQNAIKEADLRSNDRRQIEIERAFRKLGYLYLRKRQSKSEARRFAGGRWHTVKKEELAQAVAACDIDPLLPREGIGRERIEKVDLEEIDRSADAQLRLLHTIGHKVSA